MSDNKTKRINVRLTQAQHELLESHADGRPVSTHARNLLMQHLDGREQTADMKRLLSNQERGEKFQAACRCWDHNHAGE